MKTNISRFDIKMIGKDNICIGNVPILGEKKDRILNIYTGLLNDLYIVKDALFFFFYSVRIDWRRRLMFEYLNCGNFLCGTRGEVMTL